MGFGGTQSWNPYTYANNNPLSYTDPTGFVPTGCGCWSNNGNNTFTFYPFPGQVATFTNGVSNDYSLFTPNTIQSAVISASPSSTLSTSYTQFTVNYNNPGPTQNNLAPTQGTNGSQAGNNSGPQDSPATITTDQAAAQQAESQAIAASIAAAVQAANAKAAQDAAKLLNDLANTLPTPSLTPQAQGSPGDGTNNGSPSPSGGGDAAPSGGGGDAGDGTGDGSDGGTDRK